MSKKTPLIPAIVGILPGLINTVGSLIKDKKKDKDEETTFVHKAISKGVQLSSKRTLNIAGSTAIIGTALVLINANGLTTQTLILVGLGVAYSLGMAFITHLSDK